MNNSFVYCWSDKKTAKVYVGVHKGSENDGYICSSKSMKSEYQTRSEDFSRKIIAKGSFETCAELEIRINRQLLKSPNTCYNRCAGKAILMTDEIKSKIGKSVSISTTGKKRPLYIGQAISKAKKGKQFSEEHKLALSLAHKGRKDSPEIVQKRLNSFRKTIASRKENLSEI
jgi:hypothetical protein